MLTARKILAYLVAALVTFQSVVMVWAIFGLSSFVAHGGVVNAAGPDVVLGFPEEYGFELHGTNGIMVMPVVSLLLLVVALVGRSARAWAGAVFALTLLQVVIGFAAHAMPIWGGLHGLNALVLFTAALITARQPGRAQQRASTATAPATAGTSGVASAATL